MTTETDARGVTIPETTPGELPSWQQVLDYGRRCYNQGKIDALADVQAYILKAFETRPRPILPHDFDVRR